MKLSQGKKLLLLGIVLVVIDQVIKYLVKTNMELGEQINVIGQWFRLCFVENKGMAFGMSFGGQIGKFLRLNLAHSSVKSEKAVRLIFDVR